MQDGADDSFYKSDDDSEGPASDDYTQSQASTDEAISWTASEYVAHQKSASWFLIFAVVSIVLVLIIYAITRSVLSVAMIILGCAAVAIMGARKPQTIPYEISRHGVAVSNKLHTYSKFKSFSVIEEGGINSIWLRPLKKLQPTVALYYAPEDENEIVDTLSNYLPHEERQPDPIDRVSQRFRF